MKRLIAPLVLVFMVAATLTVHAVSSPIIAGPVSGIEVCAQDDCGAAVFVGIFIGRFDNRSLAIGVITAAVTHEDLTPPGGTAGITGGVWRLRLLSGRTVSGDILPNGTIFANEDNTFDVTAELRLLAGGSGSVFLGAELNHNTFPPTVTGTLAQ